MLCNGGYVPIAELVSGAVAAISLLVVALVLALVALSALVIRLRQSRERVIVLERGLEEEREERSADADPPRSLQAAERAVRTVIESAVRIRETGFSGLLMSSIDDLSRWASEDRSEIARLAAEDGSVTVFFSDIEGSTALNSEMGDQDWVNLLIAHDTLIRAHVERRDGHIVKSQGDGFMVVFGSPVDAARAGLAIQRSLSEERRRKGRRTAIRVRIGIHHGPVIARDGDFFGQTVAKSARVGAEAEGGEILVTQEVADELSEESRFALVDGREAELKGLPGTHVLWRLARARRRA